jgi:hypothetical protein
MIERLAERVPKFMGAVSEMCCFLHVVKMIDGMGLLEMLLIYPNSTGS